MSHPRRLSRALLVVLTMSGAACTGKKADATPATGQATGSSAPAAKAPLPGIDFDGLMRRRTYASFWRMVEKYPSACGKAQSLEQSVLKSDPALQALACSPRATSFA